MMKRELLLTFLLVQGGAFLVSGFSTSSSLSNASPSLTLTTKRSPATTSALFVAITSSSGDNVDVEKVVDKKELKKKEEWKRLRKEGGIFTFNTPVGALNPFAIYYGLTSIILGIPWFISLKFCQLMYFVTRGRFDKKRRIPSFLGHVWGMALMHLSRSYPEIQNLEILEKFYEKGQPAMFVANHNSWMDIPFLGATIGWRNYKMISKKELGRVPILGTAIKVAGNIMVDRTDRKSQIRTLKQGINYLKNGVHLCTFPEGTRSKTGRLMPFKNGAFKMAYKAGAPVVPISIVHSGKVMPPGWMFAMKPSYGTARVIVHEPVESKGRTEQELTDEVRRRMIEGLPEDQRPIIKHE